MSIEVMPNFLKKRAFLTPSRTALVFENKRYTFQQLYTECVDVAGRMHGYGMKRGQYVALLLSNHSESVVIMLSLQLLGIKAVLLNTRLTPEELNYQLKDSNAACLITESLFEEKAEHLDISVVFKNELFQSSFIKPTVVNEVALDEVCSLMYTSGTTGAPKGVMQTYGNHWWSAVGSSLNLGLQDSDGWLCAVPLFHISGYSILMRSVIYGIKMVLHESFDVEKTLEDIKYEKVTTMSVVSTMLTRLLEKLESQQLPSHFRCMLLGGGPAALPLLEKCMILKIPVYQTYGMTETASQFVTLSPEYSLSKIGSAGKALFPSQLKIVNSEGLELQPMISGEIYVKGPNVTKGYLNREGSHLKEGWFATGDIGFVDEEGFLYVQDRRSDLIISGGENIYPAEIEGILLGHPAIQEAGVIGVEDKEWGQVPVAFVVGDTLTSEEEIIQYCSLKLAKYKVPKRVRFVADLPRNASNKILRRSLKEWGKDGGEI